LRVPTRSPQPASHRPIDSTGACSNSSKQIGSEGSVINHSNRAKALDTILYGGLIAGVLDGADAVLFYYFTFGVTPSQLFQNIAGHLLGKQAFHEGAAAVALGVCIHFFIAFSAAATYWAFTRWLPGIINRPFIFGPIFGLGLYLFMQRLVIPLTAIPKRAVPPGPGEIVDQLLSHTLCVGLSIALMARRSARRGEQAP
jgi:hypothetical protein